jgi:hypothetical protein
MTLLSWLIPILIAVIAYEMIHRSKDSTISLAIGNRCLWPKAFLIRLTHRYHILEPYSLKELLRMTDYDGARSAGVRICPCPSPMWATKRSNDFTSVKSLADYHMCERP